MQNLLKKLFTPILLLIMMNISYAQRDFSKPNLGTNLSIISHGIFADLWVNGVKVVHYNRSSRGEEDSNRSNIFTTGGLDEYVKNGSNKYVIEFELNEQNDEYYKYRNEIFNKVSIIQNDMNQVVQDFDKNLVMLYATVDENDQIQVVVPENTKYWTEPVRNGYFTFISKDEQITKELTWMRDNMVVERIGEKVRVTIEAISFGLPQPLWEYGVPFNEAEHRKLLEEAYQNYWQALKIAKDDTTELKAIYAKALEDRAKSSSVDSSFKLLQLDKFSKELALQPLGNLVDYVVEVKDGKKARLVLPNNKTISPIIFTQSRFILPDKNVSLTPYFSIIDGQAVLSEF